ncbi:MAG: hypothetical protein IKW87_12775 [Ruminococcus sp.]|nr:hypothetical protein [Ruminococcus sp.]
MAEKGKRAITKSKKIQLIIASLLSAFLIITVPSYAWFNYQRELARLERIKSPDMLFITAANREDKINIDMNNIDVNATWNSSSNEKASYQYFVFAVAGQYVTKYNLQLAHTKNNNFTYEIYEASASNTDPSSIENSKKIEGRDYVKYEPDNNRIPSDLSEVSTHSGIDTSQPIYYSIKENSGVQAKLNGRYINVTNGNPDFDDLANDDGANGYKGKTYSYDKVDDHSVPLYWQCENIPVEDTNTDRAPFYHEYILKVSWDKNHINDLVKKDTDIVYITVSVK